MTQVREEKIRHIIEVFQQLTPELQEDYMEWLRAELQR